MAGQRAGAEIHEQEGKVVQHIDGGDRIVEFDGVEQHGRAIDLDDVAEMQIPMAMAHEAVERARFEERRQSGKPSPRRVGQLPHRFGRKQRLVAGEGPPHCLAAL